MDADARDLRNLLRQVLPEEGLVELALEELEAAWKRCESDVALQAAARAAGVPRRQGGRTNVAERHLEARVLSILQQYGVPTPDSGGNYEDDHPVATLILDAMRPDTTGHVDPRNAVRRALERLRTMKRLEDNAAILEDGPLDPKDPRMKHRRDRRRR